MIIDGYPRNTEHLRIFESILADIDRKILVALHFDVPRERLFERLAFRLVCDACGFVYNSSTCPKEMKCTACSKGTIVKRTDDSKEVLERRLGVYEKGITKWRNSLHFELMSIVSVCRNTASR